MADSTVAPKKTFTPGDGILWFVRFLKLLSVLTLLFNIAAYIILIVVGCNKQNSATALEKAFLVLASVGLVIFSIALAVAEFSPKWFIEQVYVLHYWAGRGFFILWMGIQLISNVKTLAAAASFVNAVDHSGSGTPSPSSNNALGSFMNVFGTVVGWIMIGVGATYVLLSALCLRRCLPEEHQDDLRIRLVANGESPDPPPAPPPRSGGSSSGASGDLDAMLVSNMAVALGVTSDEARRRFGGSNGRKEAESAAAKNRAAAAPTGASSVANSSVATRGGKPSDAAPAAPRKLDDDDDAAARRRGLNDDDELERAYYASHTKQ